MAVSQRLREKSWVTAAGLPAYLREVQLGKLRYFCGYVQVPNGHPAWGKHYDNVSVDVHGGLTYAGDYFLDGNWWVGFDCAHAMDFAEDDPDGTKVRDEGYVSRECERLAEQLVQMGKAQGDSE